MKITVIIPMYNSKDTIINTLNSIKVQTAYDEILEIIVVNDGSIDYSLELVEKYKLENSQMPIVIIDKSNGGVSSARNAGMEIAKGEWIAFLDSDDEWLPDKLELQIKTIIDHPEIDFLGGDTNDQGLKILWRRIDVLYKANIKDICLKMFPQPSTAILKKSIFHQIGGFDENQRYAEDGNYFFKICIKYNYYHLPVQMVYFGAGKLGFGVRGLSADLKKMHEGNVKNIKDLKKASIIDREFYIFLRIFYWMKYVRRIIITRYQLMRKR